MSVSRKKDDRRLPQIVLKPYKEEEHLAAAFALYQTALADKWPLSIHSFQAIISDHVDYRPNDHCLAEVNGQIVGLVITQVNRSPDRPITTGGIGLLIVHPCYQRQSIGRTLHRWALQKLANGGISKLHLGNGSSHYFWQAVPSNLPAALSFFQSCGWHDGEQSTDLYGRCSDLLKNTPLQANDITVRPASPNDQQAILNFEAQEFPFWLSFYQIALKQQRFTDILIAIDGQTQVVGALLLTDWRSPQAKGELPWSILLCERLGALGAVGVAASHNNKGIGSLMVQHGAQQLCSRGVEGIHISWTGRVGFYERLGYAVWHHFHHLTHAR